VTSIDSILLDEGPMLSGSLIKRLESNGLSSEAIRKRLSRLKAPVYRLGGFFTDNQSFFYHQKQIDTPEYFEKLIFAFSVAAQRYHVIVKSMVYHHGFIKKSEVASYSFSPSKNLKGHKHIDVIISGLIRQKVIFEYGDYYRLNPSLSLGHDEKHFKGLELVKDITLEQFYTWARSINLVSYEKGTFHSEFSKFQWCFVAPSYISHLVKISSIGLTPGFVLADILLNDPVNKEDVNFFIKKIEIIRSQKIPNVFPFLIVNEVSQDVLQILKKYGVTIGFIDKLFGNEYAQLLKSIINTLENAGAILKTNPEQFVNLLSQIKKLVDGKTNNLRGDLFELAVGYYYSNKCQSLDIGKKVLHDSNSKEIDVFAVSQSDLIVAECKGYKSKISLEVVEEWITKKIPVIYGWINSQQSLREKKAIFEFWSTGGFTEDALVYLQNKARSTKNYEIQFYNQEQILTKAKDSNSQKFIEIMREYFIKEAF
jgi:hypothetical protein